MFDHENEDVVVRIEFGSHLYGTNTEKSDHDFKSVYIPSADEILLQRVRDSTGHEVNRPEGFKNSPKDTDDEAYSLQRYLTLLLQGQTVAIDMLFAPSPLKTSPLWEDLKANKHRLLTKRAASFVGYCQAQANKYSVKGARDAAWAVVGSAVVAAARAAAGAAAAAEFAARDVAEFAGFAARAARDVAEFAVREKQREIFISYLKEGE